MTDFLLAAAGQPWTYCVVFLFCILDGFFPPVPSEALILALSVLVVADGGSGPWVLLMCAAAGAFLGDNIAFALGRRIGLDRFSWMRKPFMQRAYVRSERELNRRPTSILLVARFIPVARVGVNLVAGATGFPRAKFMAVTACSATLWAAYSIGLGALAGAWLGGHPILGIVVAVLVSALLGTVVDRVSASVGRRRDADKTGRQLQMTKGEEPVRVPAESAVG